MRNSERKGVPLDPNEPPGAIDMRIKGAIRGVEILYGKLAEAKKKVDDIFKLEDRKYKDVKKDIKRGIAAIDAARQAAKKPTDFVEQDKEWRIYDSEFERIREMVEGVRFEEAWKLADKLLDDVGRVYSSNYMRRHAEKFIKAMQNLVNVLGDLDFYTTMEDFSTRPELPSSARKAIKEKYIDLYSRGTKQKIVALLSDFGVKVKDVPKSPSTLMARLEAVRKKLLG